MQQTQTTNHPQETRQPMSILKVASPLRGQYLMNSQKPISKAAREELSDQVAVLKAVRSGIIPNKPITLLPTYDTKYIEEYRQLLCSRSIPLHLHPTARNGAFLTAMSDSNKIQPVNTVLSSIDILIRKNPICMAKPTITLDAREPR